MLILYIASDYSIRGIVRSVLSSSKVGLLMLEGLQLESITTLLYIVNQ